MSNFFLFFQTRLFVKETMQKLSFQLFFIFSHYFFFLYQTVILLKKEGYRNIYRHILYIIIYTYVYVCLYIFIYILIQKIFLRIIILKLNKIWAHIMELFRMNFD